jgi:hypothetical protein
MHTVFVAQCLCLPLESLAAIDSLIAQTDMSESARVELGKLPAVEQAVIRQLSTLDLLRQSQWKCIRRRAFPTPKRSISTTCRGML